MAKKKTTTAKSTPPAVRGKGPASPKSRSKPHAGQKIEQMAQSIFAQSESSKNPAIDIPQRSLSNVEFNTDTRRIEMGDSTQTRNFFNFGQARRFMQTMLVASKCKALIDADKTASIRQIYYMGKHTIRGTNEKTFNDQDESDPVLEDLEVSLDALREELHIYAGSRGALIGELTFVNSGDTIDATRLGTGGYAIPGIVEPHVLQFKKCSAKFILHLEKDTVWRRFVEDRFWEKHRCILTHGNGQPPRSVRRLLYRMHQELKLPVYVLLDNDPWGYYIYSVIKQGSINLAYESARMAVPDCKYIGVSSFDYERYELTDDVKLELDNNDVKRAKQILGYPWFAGKKPWEKEIRKMLQNGFKMEIEALVSKSLSFLTEEYVPAKLDDRRQWLD